MISKVKALTLALLAVCAIGVVAASGASAAEFHTPADGTWTGHATQIHGETEFKIKEGAVKCPNATGDVQFLNSGGGAAQTTAQTATITLTESAHSPVNEELTCTFSGAAGSIVHMNGCDILVHTSPTVQADVVCAGTNQITVTAIVGGVLKCTIHIGPQTGKTGITIGNGTAQDVAVLNAVKNIVYSTTQGVGLGACAATTTTEGVAGEFNGENTVQGTVGGVATTLQYS